MRKEQPILKLAKVEIFKMEWEFTLEKKWKEEDMAKVEWGITKFQKVGNRWARMVIKLDL